VTESGYAFEVKQKTKIKVSLYGKDYELHKPTVNEAKLLAEAKSGVSTLDDAKTFMATLGLPMEVSGEMEVEHFNLLLEVILDFNKKK
jgi:hypothetical protein